MTNLTIRLLHPAHVDPRDWKDADEMLKHLLERCKAPHISDAVRQKALFHQLTFIEEPTARQVAIAPDKVADQVHLSVRLDKEIDFAYVCTVGIGEDGDVVTAILDKAPTVGRAAVFEKKIPQKKILKMNEPLLGTRPGKR